jgi:hypothetical protein
MSGSFRNRVPQRQQGSFKMNLRERKFEKQMDSAGTHPLVFQEQYTLPITA